VSAFIVWLRGQVLDGTEEAAARWQQVVEGFNAPPADTGPTLTAGNTMSDRDAAEAAAFEAYAGMA
jgi:hypothetical protein